ncbi:restriction endonuclease subunit S [uncultured Phocaeicola sp.]|uniref:restriction endonuclease subunit S n=1 Tax=uncultured Phocaeicola sp. TaxID=990718 RepID=UPI0025A121F1|nr:restriction endonuclease subunit S [uncultured Phocaeicola sp.]
MYDVPHLRFPEFSGEWEKYRLCDVASIVGRIGFRGYTTNDIVTKGKGAIALSPTNIENNKLTYDKDNTYISFYKYEESPEIMIKQGDVIFVKTGSTVGKVAYVDKLICKTTLNPQVVVLKDIQCDNYLLSVLMSTNKFQNAIRKIIVGGAVPTLSQAAMGDIVVTMPQATEQEKLSKFISLLDDRIATQNKIIEDLKILKSAIAERLFNSTDGDILSLSDVCIIQKGKQVNGEDLSETGKFYVMNGGVEPSGYYDQCNTPANTISISEGGNSCGYIQYNRDAFWSGGHCYTLNNIQPNVCKLYLYHYLKSQESSIMKLRIGTGLPNIQKKDLEKFHILLTSKAIQESISAFLTTIDRKITNEDMLLQRFQKGKQYLLRQMFI